MDIRAFRQSRSRESYESLAPTLTGQSELFTSPGLVSSDISEDLRRINAAQTASMSRVLVGAACAGIRCEDSPRLDPISSTREACLRAQPACYLSVAGVPDGPSTNDSDSGAWSQFPTPCLRRRGVTLRSATLGPSLSYRRYRSALLAKGAKTSERRSHSYKDVQKATAMKPYKP